jgi:hypothetical protein
MAQAQVRTADFNVLYPGYFLDGLAPPFRPFVRLEVGRARVEPYVKRDISAFVHEHVESLGTLGQYADNRPHGLRCVHPLVTLIDKLDAISRLYDRDEFEANRFVRHYGDAAAIISAIETLPPAGVTDRELVNAMVDAKDIRRAPVASDPSFALADATKRKALLESHDAIGGMFWGPRVTLNEAAATIVDWLERL